MTAEQTIADAMLARHPGVNFTADCTFEGAPARLAMTDRLAVLVIADGTGREWSAPLDNTASNGVTTGSSTRRRLTLGPALVDVTFPDDAAAARFERVLRVRHGMRRPTPGEATSFSGRGPGYQPPLPHPADRSPQAQYARNARYALTAAGWAIAVGWLNVVLGVLAAVVLTIAVGPLGLLWGVLIALFGAAIPFCLGYLTRAVIYRHQLLDERES